MASKRKSIRKNIAPEMYGLMERVKQKLNLPISDHKASKILAEQLKAMDAYYNVKNKNKRNKTIKIEVGFKL